MGTDIAGDFMAANLSAPVGFIGLGAMGEPMAIKLDQSGDAAGGLESLGFEMPGRRRSRRGCRKISG